MANNPFLHEEQYRGEDLIEILSSFDILVCGCGAIGSNLVHNLVRHGFHSIGILDKDRVEKHNISTQTWTNDDIGMTKVEALSNQVFAISEKVNLTPHYLYLDEKNIKKTFKPYEIVIDCFDNNASRKLITEFASKKSKPCLHGGLNESYGEIYWNDFYRVPNDVEDGDICDYPLARNIILLTIIAMTEEIINFCLDEEKRRNFNITLKDMKISIV